MHTDFDMHCTSKLSRNRELQQRLVVVTKNGGDGGSLFKLSGRSLPEQLAFAKRTGCCGLGRPSDQVAAVAQR